MLARMLFFCEFLEVPNWTLYRPWWQTACKTRKCADRRNSTSGTGHSAIAVMPRAKKPPPQETSYGLERKIL
ncbi:hypothetical protein MBT84_47625 [Streptomyces sp. MBT84]|nr:hypothetical protein [Streptomyces sp. MBT84]